jgi:hypothetical protein
MEWIISVIERLPNLEELSTGFRLESALVRLACECIQFQNVFGAWKGGQVRSLNGRRKATADNFHFNGRLKIR